MDKPLCIYHHNCADGFAAAWAVREALPECEFYGGTHGNPPPDVAGRHVIMVDFSYKRPVLDAMAESARSILILDHHASAAEDLEGFPEAPENWAEWEERVIDANDLREIDGRAVTAAEFDMTRSGAGITWDFFHDAARPALLDHIEDRDLWRFALEGTREIQAAVFAREYDFAVWDELMAMHPAELRAEGQAIERKHFKDIRELITSAQRRMVIGGYDVPVLNAPYFFSSDAGHLMAQGEPFAACYWDTPEGRTFSLRSTAGGLDVSKIAVAFGGGGHAGAAGFRMPIGWEGEREQEPA